MLIAIRFIFLSLTIILVGSLTGCAVTSPASTRPESSSPSSGANIPLSLTSPAASEIIYIGSTVPIRWDADLPTGTKLKLSYGKKSIVTLSAEEAARGEYDWVVDSRHERQIDDMIFDEGLNLGEGQIVATLFDEADNVLSTVTGPTFIIEKTVPTLTAPAGAVTWQLGATQEISWTVDAPLSRLQLVVYSGDCGDKCWVKQNGLVIATDLPSGQTVYSWTVGSTLGDDLAPGIYTLYLTVRNNSRDIFDVGDFPITITE